MITTDDLVKVTNFETLVKVLRDQLEWPIPEDYEFGDVTYEYEAKELGLINKIVPADKVMEIAKREGATPYDVPGVEYGHHGKECSFDAFVKKHQLGSDPALVLLAKIVNGADTDNTLWQQPEAAGLNAVAEGFRHLGFKDDHELLAAEAIVYDALRLLPRNGSSRKAGRTIPLSLGRSMGEYQSHGASLAQSHRIATKPVRGWVRSRRYSCRDRHPLRRAYR